MRNDKPRKYSLLGLNDKLKAAKMTMSTAGKNQNTNNNRWTNTIHRYHDDLISH